jgi:hypothetical protein
MGIEVDWKLNRARRKERGMIRFRNFLKRFRCRGIYLVASMLGLAICWISANLLREALFGADAFRTEFVVRNSPIILLDVSGTALWMVATWQRLYRIAASDWAASWGTAALVFLWGYLFTFRIWPILAIGLILVGPVGLAIPAGISDEEGAERAVSTHFNV